MEVELNGPVGPMEEVVAEAVSTKARARASRKANPRARRARKEAKERKVVVEEKWPMVNVQYVMSLAIGVVNAPTRW